MQKAKTVLVLAILLFGLGISVYGQCPPSVYNNYQFNETSGLSASGVSGSSPVSLTNPGWVTGILGGAVSFNGTDSKGLLTDNYFDWVSNQDFTIEFWVNLKSVNTSLNMVFIGRDDPATALHWWIGAESVTGKPVFDLRDNSNIFSEVMGNTPLTANTWYHLAVVRDNVLNQNKLYVNGQLAGTSQAIYTGNFSATVPVNLGMLNYNGSDSYYANCNIDELVLHNAALDGSVIAQHYQDQLNGTPICIPTAPNPVTKILTLGNSITYDDYVNDVRPAGQRGSYRVHLYNKLTAAGYKFDFIGSEISGQDLFPDAENGGFPGINKEQMVTLLQTGFNPRTNIQVTNGPYFNFYQPDVILMHLGTNDLTTNITAINQILDIIDGYRSQSGKKVILFIAKIINRKNYDALTTQYNQNLEQAVLARNNPDNYIVDMENGAGIDYSTEMIDNLHPTSAGYEKMATLWYSSMSAVLDAPSADFIKTPSYLTTTPLQGAISLNWKDNSNNETGFGIERKTGTGPFAQIIQLPANTITYTDPGLQSSTIYTYRVNALGASGSTVYTNLSSAKTPVASNLTNLAPGKPATQSSVAYGGVPARGNDNNTDGFWSGGSVIHTTLEQSPWWQIDLQAGYNIDHIEVWNRTDACCNSRMVNYYIFVSDNPFTSANLNTTLAQSGVWNSFNANFPNPNSTIPVNRTGRYVRIQLSAQSELNLAEMRIFGSSGTPPDPTVPNAPTVLATTSNSPVSAQLNWTDNASNETGFRVERKSGTGQFAQVIELGANTVSYSDAGLQPSTGYIYRVYAFNNTGNSGFSNESTVQTQAASSATNLAPGKPVIQSSTAYGGVPERANDNNTNGIWINGSVSHTGNELSPYWQINLQAVYNIDHLEVWNRTDACCISRMADYYAFVSDVPFASGSLSTTLNQGGVWNSFNANYPNPGSTIPVNRTGQYVRIQLANQGELSMAEVKVFGTSGTPPPPTVPAAPTALNSLAISSVSTQLNWTDNASNENGYRVERKSGSGQFAQVTELGANVVAYTDAGLQPSTSYTYRVYAFNNTGNSGYSNESIIQTPVASVTNLAPGKPVIQSSTAYGGIPARGNDNNTDGKWIDGSVIHTSNELNPYWQVDLQAIYQLDNLEVWNRTDACCTSRMANFYIFVSDVPYASGNLNTTLNQSGVWNNFNASYPNPSTTIGINRTGRYVRIQLANQGELNLAEMKIFGSSLKNAGGNQADLPESKDMILLVYPNPSENEVNIEFYLQDDSKGSISVFNMMGEEMTRFTNDVFYSGNNLFTWNGLDSRGKKASPGIYVIRVVINEKLYMRKVIISSFN